jgi:hypothetical protein
MKKMMLVVAVATLAGCATTPVPADKLASAQSAVRVAEAMPETATDPRAAQHLQLARDQLAHAKRLMINGRNEDARWALMRAEADADTSLSLAHAKAAKADAQVTIEAIRQAMRSMQQQQEGGS